MGKRPRKTPRKPEKKQQPVEEWFPGSGSSWDMPLVVPTEDARPPSTGFGGVESKEIRAEIARHQQMVTAFENAFPQALIGTLGELNSAEEHAATEIARHQKVIDWLKLELASRGESLSVPVQ
jgi:hypothetical protein